MNRRTATDCARFPLRGFPKMPRWITRSLWAAGLGRPLPPAAPAPLPLPADAAPPPPLVVTPPPAVAPASAPVGAAIAIDPYRAATPYNPIVVGRPMPSPQ